MPEETITVTFGAQTFSPVQYHKFDVGPFSYTTIILPGEDIAQAYSRAYRAVEAMARLNFLQQRKVFYENLPNTHNR